MAFSLEYSALPPHAIQMSVNSTGPIAPEIIILRRPGVRALIAATGFINILRPKFLDTWDLKFY